MHTKPLPPGESPPSLAEDPVATLVREGVYASIEYQRLIPTFELDTERVARNRGFGESRARTFALSPGRLDRVLDFISDELSTEDHTLVFCLTLGHCHVVAAGLNAAGVTVGLVGSDFAVRHNQRVLKQFMQGEVRVLVNAKYAAVGVDLPNANVAIICTPIGSPIFFEQVIGRIARGPARAAPFGPSPASNSDLIAIAVCAGFRYLLGSPEMPFFSVFSRVFLQP